MPNFQTLWIRAETKPHEERCPIAPQDAAVLMDAGFRVVYEDSAQSCFITDEFQTAGCEIMPAGSWVDAPRDALIVAIKELPESESPLSHHHLYFGHAYKGQTSAPQLLSRFKAGGGTLWDWEFLNDAKGRRLVAFGYWAGYAGALVAVQLYLQQQTGREIVLSPTSRAAIVPLLQDAMRQLETPPKALVMGALGRCGAGARDCLQEMNISVTPWDKAQTQHAGPYPEILQHNIFLNAVLASPNSSVFLNTQSLQSAPDRALSVIVDVSCDPTSPYNPIPIYDQVSSFNDPYFALGTDACPLYLSAIDHLPSLLPKESSSDFSAQALPLLRQLRTNSDAEPWLSCYKAYEKAMNAF